MRHIEIPEKLGICPSCRRYAGSQVSRCPHCGNKDWLVAAQWKKLCYRCGGRGGLAGMACALLLPGHGRDGSLQHFMRRDARSGRIHSTQHDHHCCSAAEARAVAESVGRPLPAWWQ